MSSFVSIFGRQTGRWVTAELVDHLEVAELDAVARSYRIFEDAAGERIGPKYLPENADWDWSAKARAADHTACKVVGIRADGEMQGLLMLNMQPWPSRLQPGRYCLYVEYIETAPWNQRAYAGDCVRFGLVGVQLLRWAAAESVRTGNEGRLALHSLPQSEGFYRRICVDLGMDSEAHLRYFELTREAAMQLVNGRSDESSGPA